MEFHREKGIAVFSLPPYNGIDVELKFGLVIRTEVKTNESLCQKSIWEKKRTTHHNW